MNESTQIPRFVYRHDTYGFRTCSHGRGYPFEESCGVPIGHYVAHAEATLSRFNKLYSPLSFFLLHKTLQVLYIIRADFLAMTVADPMTAFNLPYYARLMIAFNTLYVLCETVRPVSLRA